MKHKWIYNNCVLHLTVGRIRASKIDEYIKTRKSLTYKRSKNFFIVCNNQFSIP